MRQFVPHLATLAVFAATVSACAHSPIEPTSQPDPVIITKTEVRMICPGELLLEVPAPPSLPVGASISASAAVMDWLAARFRREALLAERLADASADCRKEVSK